MTKNEKRLNDIRQTNKLFAHPLGQTTFLLSIIDELEEQLEIATNLLIDEGIIDEIN